jgi:hypothetical protein
MVEIEIGVLAAQCLDRRIGSIERLTAETAAWDHLQLSRSVLLCSSLRCVGAVISAMMPQSNRGNVEVAQE